jgi:hypothetical protein
MSGPKGLSKLAVPIRYIEVAFLLLKLPVILKHVIENVSLVCKNRIGATRKTKVACSVEESILKTQRLFGALDDTCEVVQGLLGRIKVLTYP